MARSRATSGGVVDTTDQPIQAGREGGGAASSPACEHHPAGYHRSMTSPRRRPARGVRRRTCLPAAWFVAAAAVLPLLAGSLSASAAPATAELRLTSFSPISIGYGQTVRASGTFTTTRAVDDVRVQFEIGGTAFIARSAITEAAANPPYTSPVPGADDDLGKVRADQSATYRIRFPSADLPFDRVGVYPMRVSAVDTATGTELASVSSFLPWAPDDVGVVPSRLLMLWPVIGDTELTTAATEPGTTDQLERSLTPDGRLDTLVEAGVRAPVTWLLDPAVVHDVAMLRTSAAEDWIAQVGQQAATDDIVALPYADPDVAAVAEANRPGFLEQGDRRSDSVDQALLDNTPRTDLAWPADGAGDEDTIATAARAGDAFVLLDEDTAPLLTPQTFTPSGRLAWQDPDVDVLLADEPASALMASPASAPGDVLLARQRFLAETLLHSQEVADPRLLVMAPPRRWDPSRAWADALATAVRRATWLNPVSLDRAVAPSPPPFERNAPAVPDEAAEAQLPGELVRTAQTGLVDNRRFAAILTRPGRLTPAIEDALLSSVSTAWRGDTGAATTSQQQVLDQLETLRGKVRIVSQGGTLSDDRGSFPVTIRNQLDQPVVVGLQVTSTDPLRLRVNGPDETIRIPPQRSVSQPVDLDAVTSGRLAFDAQLLTPRGVKYDEPVTVVVDVRGFGQITLLVFGAAVALLVIAAAMRITRRIRRSRDAAS
jgi:hypothetical protein